jgi:predicted acetyltransferase
MDISITEATQSQELTLSHLLELYQYDFSEFDGADVDEDGQYGYPYLQKYWTEPGRKAFLVRVNGLPTPGSAGFPHSGVGALAGFVLVAEHSYFPSESGSRAIAEFFIMRKYRGRGVGEAAARHVFNLLPGKWQVAQISNNTPAQAFWRKIIGRYTGGNYQEVVLEDESWRGPVQIFDNGNDRQENA